MKCFTTIKQNIQSGRRPVGNGLSKMLRPTLGKSLYTSCESIKLDICPITLNNTGQQPQYTWSPSTGLDNSHIANPTANLVGTTNYTLNIKIPSTDQSCDFNSNITVKINPKPSVSVSDQTICSSDHVTLSVINPDAGNTYLWSTSATTTSITVSNGGVYNVTAINEYNCSTTVSAKVKPNCYFIYSDCNFFLNCLAFTENQNITQYYFEVFNAANSNNCIPVGNRIWPISTVTPFSAPPDITCNSPGGAFHVPFDNINLNYTGFDENCFRRGIGCNNNYPILLAGIKYLFRLWGYNSVSSSWKQLGSDDCITLNENNYCVPATRLKSPTDSLKSIYDMEYCEIIPNPLCNDGILHYKSSHENNYFIIYNLYGEIVFKSDLSGKEGEIKLNVSSLQQGVYHYILHSDKQIINTNKLIIIR